MMQGYAARVGFTHQNIHLNEFLIENGFEVNAVLSAYQDQFDLEDLVDIRENSAYIAFVSMIGGYINFEENGYEILSKQYKRELKYAGGNLMKIQMKQIVDKAVDTILNYFQGFMTYDQIKNAVGNKPLRSYRIFVMKEWKSTKKMLEEAQKKREEEERAKRPPQSKYEEVQMKKRAMNLKNINAQQVAAKMLWDQEAVLNLPDFFDYQDFVNPVFRLDLALVTGTLGSSFHLRKAPTKRQSTYLTSLTNTIIGGGETLDFSKREEEIIEGFDLWIKKTIESFNENMVRPEFSKVKVASQKRHDGDLEEEARQRKLTLQAKRAVQAAQNLQAVNKSKQSFLHPSQAHFHQKSQSVLSVTSRSRTAMSVPVNTTAFSGIPRQKDFEHLLYNGNEDGPAVYKKWLGRVHIFESERNTKDLIDENNLGVYSKSYIEKQFEIADADQEECYVNMRETIKEILRKHLNEAKRTTEIFQQFDPIIKGTLQQKVLDFIFEERQDAQYHQLLKELRYYEKLSTQLPTIVFFPMFEVSTIAVKEEIQRRIANFIKVLFKKYETTMITRSSGLCEKYQQICKYLDKVLKTPQDVVDMEWYNNNLLLELGNLQDKMYENRKSMFFLINNDKILEEESMNLINQLHHWPQKLNLHMDQCDDRHSSERIQIENQITRKKELFEKNELELEENIKEVQLWADLSSYRIVISKVIDYQNLIEQYEEQMIEISQDEMMIFGFKSSFEVFLRVKQFFEPYYDLWTLASEFMVNKRKWLESSLSLIDPEEVDNLIQQSLKILSKVQKDLEDNQNSQKVITTLTTEVNDLHDQLPTIEILCNPDLQQHHWQQIQTIVKANFNYQEISLNEVKYLQIEEFLERLAIISQKATQEAQIEAASESQQESSLQFNDQSNQHYQQSQQEQSSSQISNDYQPNNLENEEEPSNQEQYSQEQSSQFQNYQEQQYSEQHDQEEDDEEQQYLEQLQEQLYLKQQLDLLVEQQEEYQEDEQEQHEDGEELEAEEENQNDPLIEID